MTVSDRVAGELERLAAFADSIEDDLASSARLCRRIPLVITLGNVESAKEDAETLAEILGMLADEIKGEMRGVTDE